ncbi:hypothetical protein [Bradyrhizobium tropiciagri]|uniref:hypothetical protein n=1 Tax=Bradyrhizobium tropiciagri TaxID=312253 RepID=UPI001FCCE8A5|nr:hypothetical protein [Bradyrhizobium tropiciagri]
MIRRYGKKNKDANQSTQHALLSEAQMLHVKIEVWPGGDQARARAIAIANIANISDLSEVSDYAIRVTEAQNPIAGTPPWTRDGHVLRHERNTSVWKLIAKVAAWAAEEAAKTT